MFTANLWLLGDIVTTGRETRGEPDCWQDDWGESLLDAWVTIGCREVDGDTTSPAFLLACSLAEDGEYLALDPCNARCCCLGLVMRCFLPTSDKDKLPDTQLLIKLLWEYLSKFPHLWKIKTKKKNLRNDVCFSATAKRISHDLMIMANYELAPSEPMFDSHRHPNESPVTSGRHSAPREVSSHVGFLKDLIWASFS